MNRISASVLAFVLGTAAVAANAQAIGVGDASAYPQGVAQAATALAQPMPQPARADAQVEPEYVLKGDVFVANPAWHADAAKSRAEVRRDARTAPQVRFDDASTRG